MPVGVTEAASAHGIGYRMACLDACASDGFWLVQDYFPDLLAIDRTLFPSIATLADALGELIVPPVPIPAGCVDGFLGAFWRRRAAYLESLTWQLRNTLCSMEITAAPVCSWRVSH